MAVLGQDQEPPSGGMGTILLIGAGAVALIVAGYFAVTMMMRPAPEPMAPPSETRSAAPPPRVVPKPVEVEKEPEAPRAAPRPKPRREKPAEPEPAPAAPAGPVLVVESDVPGATVFVDRKYVGMTPLRTTDVAAGTHQLNASATGEDGVVQSIEVGESGETAITVKFREVRLDVAVAAVHKHAMGACDGRLVATPAGLAYQTTNRKDAFALGFGAIEVFDIDYLNKALRVKQRGGRTWNFTDRSENADKLFVFHRDVTKAREKIAALAK